MTKSVHTLLPLALLLSSTSAFAQTTPWIISEVRGSVFVRSDAGERQVERGAQVLAGQQVITAKNGNATLVRGNEFVTVRANSRITIAPEQRDRSVVQIIQDFGSALFNIGKQEKPHFGVDTPYMAAVVKGTRFSITVSEAGASMQVTEGAVEASTLDGGASDLVVPGEVAMIGTDDLFTLSIEGDLSREVVSPQGAVNTNASRPQAVAVQAAPTRRAAPMIVASSVTSDGAVDEPTVIEVAVGSRSADLGELTDGIVQGEVGDKIEAEVEDTVEDEADRGQPDGDNVAPPAEPDPEAEPEPEAEPAPQSDPQPQTDPADDSDEDADRGPGSDEGGEDADNPGNGNGNGNGNGGAGDPGNGGGNGNGNGAGDPAGDDGNDDGNRGHGNDDDGNDDDNPGNGNGNGNGNGGAGGPGNGGGNGKGQGKNAGGEIAKMEEIPSMEEHMADVDLGDETIDPASNSDLRGFFGQLADAHREDRGNRSEISGNDGFEGGDHADHR